MMVPVVILLFWCLSLGGASVEEDDHDRRVLRTLYRDFSGFVPPGHEMAVLYLEPPTSIFEDNKIRLVAPYMNVLHGMFYQVLEMGLPDYSWVVWPDNIPGLAPTFNTTNRPNFAVAREDWDSLIVTKKDKKKYKNAYRHPEFLLLKYFVNDMLTSYQNIFGEYPKSIYLLSYNFPAQSCAKQIKKVAKSLVSNFREDSQLILGYYRIRASEDWKGIDLTEKYNIKLINLDEPTKTPGGDLRCINTGTSLIQQNTTAEYSSDNQFHAANSNPQIIDLLNFEEGSSGRWYNRDFSLVPQLETDCDFRNILALKLSSVNGFIDIVWYDNDFFKENYSCPETLMAKHCQSWIGLYESAEKEDNDFLMMDRAHVANYGVIHTAELAVDGMEVRLFHSTTEEILTFQKSNPWQSDCGYDPVAIDYNSQDANDTEPQMMMQLEVNSGEMMTYFLIGGITPDCCTNAGSYSFSTEEFCLWDVYEIFLQSGRSAAKGQLTANIPSKMWFLSEMDCEPHVSLEMEWATCQCTYDTTLSPRYYKTNGDYGFRLVARVGSTTPTVTTNASPEWLPGVC